jgi:hypothetical protein
MSSKMTLFPYVRTPVLLADFVRRADRRGTSERSLGEGRYWREGESLLALLYCQDYFFKFPIFLAGLALGLRLTFAFLLPSFRHSPNHSQFLVPLFQKHHNPRGRLAATAVLSLFLICQPRFQIGLLKLDSCVAIRVTYGCVKPVRRMPTENQHFPRRGVVFASGLPFRLRAISAKDQ